MIPLTILCDVYIDRPKLSEKKPVEYIVPPPFNWVGQLLWNERIVMDKKAFSKYNWTGKVIIQKFFA